MMDAESKKEPLDTVEIGEATPQDPAGELDANVLALLESLGAVTQERDEAKESMLRAVAELQNVRRRSQEQIESTRKLATEGLVLKILPVLDNFERTLKAIESGASVASITEGVKGVESQLRAVLDTVLVKRIASVGEAFDPVLHDAIAVHDHPELPANVVSEEIEPGYTMAGQVIRPAKVRVAKGA